MGTLNTALQLLYKLALKVECFNPYGSRLKVGISVYITTKSTLAYCAGLIPVVGTAYVLWNLFSGSRKARFNSKKDLSKARQDDPLPNTIKNAILNNPKVAAGAFAISNESDIPKTVDALVAWKAWTTQKWKNLFEDEGISEEQKRQTAPLFAAWLQRGIPLQDRDAQWILTYLPEF